MSPTKTREEGENNKDDDSKKPHCPSEEMGALLCDMFFLLLVSPYFMWFRWLWQLRKDWHLG
jgi:hypothetical protein